jgi:hypothetical protein
LAEFYALANELFCRTIGPENYLFVFTQIFFDHVSLNAENNSEHFWSANLVMKIKIAKIMGDQKDFWIKTFFLFFN